MWFCPVSAPGSLRKRLPALGEAHGSARTSGCASAQLVCVVLFLTTQPDGAAADMGLPSVLVVVGVPPGSPGLVLSQFWLSQLLVVWVVVEALQACLSWRDARPHANAIAVGSEMSLPSCGSEAPLPLL